MEKYKQIGITSCVAFKLANHHIFWNVQKYEIDENMFVDPFKIPIDTYDKVGNSCFKATFRECTVCFTDLDQGSEILTRFSLRKSIKHSVWVVKISIRTSSIVRDLPLKIHNYV